MRPGGYGGAVMPEPRSGERALRSKFILIFRGGAVSQHDLSPSQLQAHVEKWYRWSDELARQGRGNAGTALDNPGAAIRGHERVVTDGPYAESKDLVTGSLIIEAASWKTPSTWRARARRMSSAVPS